MSYDGYNPYPKMLYPVDGGAPVTVADAAAHEALGAGFAESPATADSKSKSRKGKLSDKAGE